MQMISKYRLMSRMWIFSALLLHPVAHVWGEGRGCKEVNSDTPIVMRQPLWHCDCKQQQSLSFRPYASDIIGFPFGFWAASSRHCLSVGDGLTTARFSVVISRIFASDQRSFGCQSPRTDNGIENLLTKSSKKRERRRTGRLNDL